MARNGIELHAVSTKNKVAIATLLLFLITACSVESDEPNTLAHENASSYTAQESKLIAGPPLLGSNIDIHTLLLSDTRLSADVEKETVFFEAAISEFLGGSDVRVDPRIVISVPDFFAFSSENLISEGPEVKKRRKHLGKLGVNTGDIVEFTECFGDQGMAPPPGYEVDLSEYCIGMKDATVLIASKYHYISPDEFNAVKESGTWKRTSSLQSPPSVEYSKASLLRISHNSASGPQGAYYVRVVVMTTYSAEVFDVYMGFEDGVLEVYGRKLIQRIAS